MANIKSLVLAGIAFSQILWAGPIRTIILVDESDHLVPDKEAKTLDGVQLRGVDLPGSLNTLQDQLELSYEQTPSQIKQKIYQYYQSQGHPFVVVTEGRVDSRGGVVQFIVQESVLGEISVEGNCWTPRSRYLNYIELTPGEPIFQKTLSRDIDFINRNPFRFVDVVYSPGTRENTTDLLLAVKDRRPYRFYLGFDNTGVPTTGRQRVFAGFSWDQVFGQDHSFFYQYTTNYDVNRFHANTFQYMALLPWRSLFNLYGGYSTVSTSLPLPEMKNKGTNIQASLRYIYPLAPGNFFEHALSFGGDYKRTNNTMAFVDFTPTFGKTVNLTQLMAGYDWKYEKKGTRLTAGAECFYSPGSWLPSQTIDDFSSLRPGTKPEWVYGKAYFTMREPVFKTFAWLLEVSGEATSGPLLPSEQLGLGGYGSVRGYDERQYNGDYGLQGSFELHSPLLIKRKQCQCYFLAFIDGGIGWDRTKVPEIPWWDYLVGAGPGVRFSWSDYITARLDWGFKLHHQEDFTGGSSMLQFSTIGSY